MIQAASLVGALLILAAFVLQQRGVWRAGDAAYLWANFVGSSVLTVVAWVEAQWGFLVLEAAWAAVSFWGLLKRKGAA